MPDTTVGLMKIYRPLAATLLILCLLAAASSYDLAPSGTLCFNIRYCMLGRDADAENVRC
jgi:hypothetical protein